MTGPVAWVSPEQLTAHKDRLAGEGGDYLPARLTRDGLFTQPLYAAPQPAPAIDLEQFREAVEAELDAAEKACEGYAFAARELSDARAKHARLLALIDGQANDSNAAMAAEYRRWIDFYHSGGSGAYGYEAFLASMQPTKGEGVAGG